MGMITWLHLLNRENCFSCNCGESRYIVVGLPMDWTTTYVPGTRFAPRRIREASCDIEMYSLLARRSVEDTKFNDLGDAILPFGDVAGSLNNIERITRGLVTDFHGYKYFFLGGEHLVTLPIVKGLRDQIDHLIVFDAHGDLRDEYMGLKHSHASVMRRIIEEADIPVTIIGVRALSSEETVFIEKNGDVEIIYSGEKIDREKLPRGRRVYVSIDMDAIDPGFAPGVSNPEPLGLTPYELLSIIGEIVKNNDLVGIDVVEVNPLMDVNNVTSILASKIIYEVIGFISR